MNARRPLMLAMLVAPLGITLIAVAVMLVAGGDLTREVVLHWGPSGPDGWGPAWVYPLFAGLIGAVLPIVMWATMGRSGRVGSTIVFLAGFMIWMSAFLGVGLSAALLAQPDDIGWWFLVAALVGLVLAAPAWLWLPRDPDADAALPELPHVEIAPGEALVWSRSVVAPAAFSWAIPLVVVATLVVSIIATTATDGRAAAAFVAPVLLSVMFLLSMGWRVSAGPTGLTVRGLVGVPVFRVALADIAAASPVQVEPMADFGGWGIRWTLGPGGKGRTGIVTRAGEALQVTRRDGRQLVVTVDDAAMAAAVLRAHLATAT